MVEDFSVFQAISDYGLAIVATIGAGAAAWKLLHFMLRDVATALKNQDEIIIALIDKNNNEIDLSLFPGGIKIEYGDNGDIININNRVETLIQRMDSKLDTVLQHSSDPLLKESKERYRS